MVSDMATIMLSKKKDDYSPRTTPDRRKYDIDEEGRWIFPHPAGPIKRREDSHGTDCQQPSVSGTT